MGEDSQPVLVDGRGLMDSCSHLFRLFLRLGVLQESLGLQHDGAKGWGFLPSVGGTEVDEDDVDSRL